MAQFTSDGLALAYDDFGPRDARKAVVLVHGFSANKYENWKRMGWYDAIAGKGLRGLAIDNRGHGESAKPHEPEKYAREAMARDVFALMDHAGDRARAPRRLLDGLAHRADRRAARRRPHRSSRGERRRRQDLRAGARPRRHGAGDGSADARCDLRSDAEELPPLRRRAEGGPAGAGRLLARAAHALHARHADGHPPPHLGDRRHARPTRRPAAGPGRRDPGRQGRRRCRAAIISR